MKKKVYAMCHITAKTEEMKKVFSGMVEVQKTIEEFPEGTVAKNLNSYHNYIREILNLPNKIFAFSVNKNTDEVTLHIFDKEPDENVYRVCLDESVPYIIVEKEGDEISDNDNHVE